MKIQEDIKNVIEGSSYVTIVTVGEAGEPHPIIVGNVKAGEDAIIIGIYKMEVTQKNLQKNPKVWMLAATVDGGPKGYRLVGNAVVKDKEVIFTPEGAELLL